MIKIWLCAIFDFEYLCSTLVWVFIQYLQVIEISICVILKLMGIYVILKNNWNEYLCNARADGYLGNIHKCVK